MNAMYRWTRHVYDASRKYYLLGRDHLIERLNAREGDIVIEAGCGTARNLIKMARRYKGAQFYGFDASDEMLKTARKNVELYASSRRKPGSSSSLTLKDPGFRRDDGIGETIPIATGFAQSFNPKALFGLDAPPDKIVFSYALSIIPPWRESLHHALNILPPGGEIHIVDFGGQDALPAPFRRVLFWWLSKFHVYYKPEILAALKTLAEEGRITLDRTSLYRGYAYYAVLKKR